jgi:uncharacterized protein YndB with AHSA1/START domain
MPAILHDLQINAPAGQVFRAVSEPSQVDCWWSLECAGTPELGAEYRLFFGAPWDWRARVSRFEPDRVFEWEITAAMDDWVGTRVGFELVPLDQGTKVRFHHTGWAEQSEHFRVSSYCWAMLLRLLKVYVERGAVMPHAERLLL